MLKIFSKITCAILLTVVSSTAASEEKKITFAGSSTIIPIMESLAPVFSKYGQPIAIQGGGSSAAFKAVRDGMADIGMVSRSLTASELKKYQHFAFAGDLIVIIAHQSNPISDINDATIRAIYTGEKTSWDHGKNITVISKESGRATQEVFEQHFKLFGQVTPKAVVIGANGQAIASVENDPQAIAYVSYDSAMAAQKNGSAIKILALNGVSPSMDAAKSQDYQLKRELNLIYTEQSEQAMIKVKQILKTAEADEVLHHHSVINYGKI